ncbi:MAG: hypothetical protein ACYSX0_18050 [Planctomycetota bacterium]
MPATRAQKLLLLRVFHGLFSVFFVLCIGVIYYSGITDSAENWALGACGFLLLEGILVAASGWECPLDYLHRSLGDDKGFFGLFLPRSWHRRMIPILSVVTGVGVVMLVLRSIF